MCHKQAHVKFSSVFTCDIVGYAFNYNTSTPARKSLPRAELAHFVGMDSDHNKGRFYVHPHQNFRNIRLSDFHKVSVAKLLSVSALLDGLSNRCAIDEIKEVD